MNHEIRNSIRGRTRTVVGVLSAICFGVLGYSDEHIPGAVSGALLGAIVGGVAADVLVVLVSWILAPAIPLSTAPTSLWRKLGRYAATVAGTAFLVVVVHEGYWGINAVAADNAVGLSNRISRCAKKSQLQEVHNEGEFTLLHFATRMTAARPCRWLLTEENQITHDVLLDLVDLIDGKKPKRTELVKEQRLLTAGVGFLFKSNDWLSRNISSTLAGQVSRGINHAMASKRYDFLGGLWGYRIYQWFQPEPSSDKYTA